VFNSYVTFCVLSDDSYENVIFRLFSLIFFWDRHLFPVVSNWRRETVNKKYAAFYYENGNFLLFKVSLSERRSAPYVQHVDNDAKRREILCFMGHFCSKNKLTPRRYLHCTTANINIRSFVLFNDISISLHYESQTNIYIRGNTGARGLPLHCCQGRRMQNL